MASRVLQAEIVYPLEYVAFGSRRAQVQYVVECVPLTFAERRADEAPVVMEVVPAGARSKDDGKATTQVRLRDGALLARPRAFMTGDPMSLDDLDRSRSTMRSIFQVPHELFKTYLGPDGAPLPIDRQPMGLQDIPVLRMLSSGRDTALSHAQSRADLCCVIDGEPWLVAKPHYWVADLRVKGSAAVLGTLNAGSDDPVPLFAPMHLDDALAHADWMRSTKAAATPAQRRSLAVPAVAEGSCEFMGPVDDAAAYGYRELASRSLGSLEKTHLGAAFSTMPCDLIEAWVAHRRAAARLRAGDAGAVEPAFEALRSVMEALPPTGMGDDGSAAQTNLGRLLPGLIRYHDAYLSRLAPAPVLDEEDALAMGGLR